MNNVRSTHVEAYKAEQHRNPYGAGKRLQHLQRITSCKGHGLYNLTYIIMPRPGCGMLLDPWLIALQRPKSRISELISD